MILYIKRGCPWCDDAEAWLRAHGVAYSIEDVLSNPEAYATMRKLSGQSKAPVLLTEDNRVLADFGSEELPGFLGKH
jgi:glutaredoxin 3